jgi:hypothetical protein
MKSDHETRHYQYNEKSSMEIDTLKKWRIGDIIDLEYFFHRDAVSQTAEDQQYLHERDRTIFLDSVRPGIKEGKTQDRQFIIQAWLNRRREEETAEDAVLPGEGFASLYSSFRLFFVLAGLFSGAGAGLSFLGYTGDRPLNVFVYLSVFVFSQLLLLLLLLVLSIYRLQKRSFLSSSPLYKAIGRFMIRTVLWAGKRISGKAGADRRSRMEAALGLIMSKGSTYGFLIFLPVFILTQLFAVGFNLGLLATTLFKVITADIAFGWQSTLQLSPAAVHALVQKIALPWSWLASGYPAFPSLAQIEGSRIILKEGIYHLSTPDLASWWPFLCFSVLFYGLLPRLLLFLGAAAAQRRHLGALDFRQGAYEQLLLRMTTPLVSTRGLRVDAAGSAVKEAEADNGGNVQAADDRSVGKNLLVMIPDDIYSACSQHEIESAVKNRFAAAVTEIVRINEDSETDTEILANLQNSRRLEETDILLIQEAWQPPILEYLDFIKSLRQAIGPGPSIRIGLIGKPLANTIFTPVKDANRKIWARKITAIGDPRIYAVGLVHNAA